MYILKTISTRYLQSEFDIYQFVYDGIMDSYLKSEDISIYMINRNL